MMVKGYLQKYLMMFIFVSDFSWLFVKLIASKPVT